MIEQLITGIIYTEFEEALGPTPKLWLPSELSMDLRMLISIKTITLLAGEGNIIPNSLIIIPFPSLNLKGIVKYIQWNDETRRGGSVLSAITLLFKEIDDVIFYKYMKNLEPDFDNIAKKLAELEPLKADIEIITEEIKEFQKNILNILEELRNEELSAQEAEPFPEKDTDSVAEFQYRFKVIVCGDPAVGKTSTVLRFVQKAFKRTYMPTIGVNISEKIIRIGNSNIQLVLWDVAGQQKFEAMRKHLYEKAEGIFLVFDLTRENTFASIPKWYEDIKKSIEITFGTVGFILGNKNDLGDERKVKRNDAEKLAEEIKFEYLETSALTGENIEEAFYKIAETLVHLKKIMKLKRK